MKIFENYLHAYSVIMNKQKERWLDRYHYIDAFAGSGYYPLDEDANEFVEGSTLVALKTDPPFDSYWFIEIDENKVRELESLSRERFPHKDIFIESGDANDILVKKIIPYLKTWNRTKRQRAIVILDPYGLQIEWNTILELANSYIFDVFINFSIMGIIRNLPLDRFPDDSQLKLIERIMGDSDIVKNLYKSFKTLFGENLSKRATIIPEFITCHYLKKVNEVFPYTSKPVIMRNSKNAPLYALFLASHKEVAMKITNDIMGKLGNPITCQGEG